MSGRHKGPGRGVAFRRRLLARRHAAALDRALDAGLHAESDGPEELAAELGAARALKAEAGAEWPPPAALVTLRAALAARGGHPYRRRWAMHPALPGSLAAVAASLLAFVALSGGRQPSPPPDQGKVALSLQLVGRQMAVTESRAAAGDLTGVAAAVEHLRATLLQDEQAAAQLDPGDPQQQLLLATLSLEITRLNSLLVQLHLHIAPLPTLSAYLPTTTSTNVRSASLSPADTTSTSCATASGFGGRNRSSTSSTSTTRSGSAGLGAATSVPGAAGPTTTTTSGSSGSTTSSSPSSTTSSSSTSSSTTSSTTPAPSPLRSPSSTTTSTTGARSGAHGPSAGGASPRTC